MQRTPIREARTQIGASVLIDGFVQAVRDQKSVQFVVLRDHTGIIQATVERSPAKQELNEMVSSLTREIRVQVIGTVSSNPGVKLVVLSCW